MTAISPPDITVFHIADWFLARSKAEDKPLKHMKLQKLVYFAYGWYYAFYDYNVPLFAEEIYAWRYGPVVRDLYEKYKSFGSHPIIAEIDNDREFDEDVSRILRHVWGLYASCSDYQLSNITHRHDAPWNKTYRRDEWIPYAKIEPELIREYFQSLRTQYAKKY